MRRVKIRVTGKSNPNRRLRRRRMPAFVRLAEQISYFVSSDELQPEALREAMRQLVANDEYWDALKSAARLRQLRDQYLDDALAALKPAKRTPAATRKGAARNGKQ